MLLTDIFIFVPVNGLLIFNTDLYSDAYVTTYSTYSNGFCELAIYCSDASPHKAQQHTSPPDKDMELIATASKAEGC